VIEPIPIRQAWLTRAASLTVMQNDDPYWMEAGSDVILSRCDWKMYGGLKPLPAGS
jgi:hypothetical protein